MLDTMTLTKVGGAFCGALLIFLLGGWAAEGLYHVGGDGHGEEHAQGYKIDTGADDADAEVVEVVAVPFEEIYATADAAAGEGEWRQCRSCHKLEAGVNGTGPYLAGIVGRAKGTADGFDYSDVIATMGGEWTPENIANFIMDPRGYAQGTKMSYTFRGDMAAAANLIAYLETQQ